MLAFCFHKTPTAVFGPETCYSYATNNLNLKFSLGIDKTYITHILSIIKHF